MKINFINDTIQLDFTEQRNEVSEERSSDDEVCIIQNHYLIPVIKGLSKSSHLVGKFSVIPHSLSCTCKNYRINSKLYKKRDLRRVCKHVFTIRNSMYNERLDELTRILLEHRFWYSVDNVLEIKIGKVNLFIGLRKEKDFFLIYKKNSNWKFYKYLLSTRSWDNSAAPFKDVSQNSKLIEYLRSKILL